MTQAIVKKENTQAVTEALISPENAYRPNTNIYHTPEAFLFEVELPGVQQEDIDLEITEKNVLVLKAKNSFTAPESHTPVISQIRHGNYYRAFELGEQIDRESVSAKLELGVLNIQIAKQEKARPKRITVNI